MDSSSKSRKVSKVFIYVSIAVAILVALGAIFPEQFNNVAGSMSAWITERFGWYYMILTTFFVFFCLFLILSPIGKLKLGKPKDEPEFRTISWLAMLFSAGMGIGLVFYGASEPISHYVAPPDADPETHQAVLESMRGSFLHWGIHAWAIYGVVGLSLAYSQFRRGEVGLLSKALRPLFGDKVDGPLGIVVDVLAVFATVIGVAVSLGVGALQINGGLNYLLGIPQNLAVQGIIIVIVTVLFLYSAWTGLSKGIQYLSNLNILLAGLLLAGMLIIGPTMIILNMMTSGAGAYLQTFLFNSLDIAAPLNEQKSEWMADWTLYYWGWWMSWSPFVGVFIARISKGRSIREFVVAVLIVPTIISIVWFSAFGMTGITVGQQATEIFELAPEEQLFAVFDQIPFGTILSIIAVMLVASFFVTSADSATFVLGMQTSFGSLTPSNRVKLVWGLSLSAIAFVLLFAGGETGLDALQAAAITAALPFSLVIILLVAALFKDANQERKYLGLSITPNKKRLQDYRENTPEEHEKEVQAFLEKEDEPPKGI